MDQIKQTIVAALIYSQDNKLLMGKKNSLGGGIYKHCWHLPGGEVKDGENHLIALKRGIKQELGIDISSYEIENITNKDTGIVNKILADRKTLKIVIEFNIYKIILNDKNSAEINLVPGEQLTQAKWFETSELKYLKLTPPTTRYFKKIGYI